MGVFMVLLFLACRMKSMRAMKKIFHVLVNESLVVMCVKSGEVMRLPGIIIYSNVGVFGGLNAQSL